MVPIIPSKFRAPTVVAQTPVIDRKTGKSLMVSTIRIAADYYDTVVFDDSADKRHAGMVLAGHEDGGIKFGPYVIDEKNIRSASRDEAMEQHREALYAARTETPKQVAR